MGERSYEGAQENLLYTRSFSAVERLKKYGMIAPTGSNLT